MSIESENGSRRNRGNFVWKNFKKNNFYMKSFRAFIAVILHNIYFIARNSFLDFHLLSRGSFNQISWCAFDEDNLLSSLWFPIQFRLKCNERESSLSGFHLSGDVADKKIPQLNVPNDVKQPQKKELNGEQTLTKKKPFIINPINSFHIYCGGKIFRWIICWRFNRQELGQRRRERERAERL